MLSFGRISRVPLTAYSGVCSLWHHYFSWALFIFHLLPFVLADYQFMKEIRPIQHDPTQTDLCSVIRSERWCQLHLLCVPKPCDITLSAPVTNSHLQAFPAEICLSGNNGQSTHSNCLFSLFMGAQKITEQLFKRIWTLTPSPWGHITEGFSWSSQRYSLGSLWFENLQSDEAEEIGKLVMVRKISSCTYIVVALNCLHVLHYFSTAGCIEYQLFYTFWQVS